MTKNKSDGVSITSYLKAHEEEEKVPQTDDVGMLEGAENLDLSFHLLRHFKLFDFLFTQNLNRHLDSSRHVRCHYGSAQLAMLVHFTLPKDPAPSVSSKR